MDPQRFIGLDSFDLAVAGFLLGVVAFLVAIPGIYLAWLQLRKTATALQATQQAVARTERHLATNQLLVVVPRLHWLENHLDDAIDDQDLKAARRSLNEWRVVASEVQGLLVGEEHGALREDLRLAVIAAANAKNKLVPGNLGNRAVATARNVIADTTQRALVVANSLKAYSEGKELQ